MGCFWSKDDTEEVPRNNRLVSRYNEEIRPISIRPTMVYNLTTQRYVTPITPNYPTSSFNQPNQLQTRQVKQHIAVLSKVKPTNSTSTDSVGRRKCGPVIVNSIERGYKPLASNNSKVDSKLSVVNETNIEQPKFGEYKCKKCGRAWNSRLCWPDKYQICKKCKNSVYAHSHRKLQPSDISEDPEKIREHPKELCEKCKRLGSYCNSKVFKSKVYSQASTSMYKRD
ncbi:uncharacterized protein LOC124538666 [Vanessa cardui]|uniref:uncharacterized protein LOC124538666 n=1 Tax=Vanessa cardui TaxID=171605 RepID=UPI001F144F11|nr:uncharacterized protein LOC124538666 [Vanessa cardui]